MKNAKKGQAALEYLMTYGWAILVIVIVLGILLLLFTNMSKVQRCMTPVGFSCGDSQPIATTVGTDGTLQMSMVLQNGLGKSIHVQNVQCYSGSEPTTLATGTAEDVTIGAGNTQAFKSVQCYFSSDVTQKATGSANQQFNGVMVFQYTEVPDSLATSASPRKMTVSISTPIVQG